MSARPDLSPALVPASTSGADGAAFPVAASETPSPLESDGRNGVFTSLVKGDDDITGLVAYSVFKQNELDWLHAFRSAKGRDPSDAETEAYILGESTSRRLSTYRHLADATLAGRGPDMEGAPRGSRTMGQRSDGAGALSGNSVIAYVAVAIVVLIAVYLAVRAGLFR